MAGSAGGTSCACRSKRHQPCTKIAPTHMYISSTRQGLCGILPVLRDATDMAPDSERELVVFE